MEKHSDWNIAKSLELYQIPNWGEGFFGVNQEGDLCVYPDQNPNGPVINIKNIIEEVRKEGIGLPAVFRFHDILRSRIQSLNQTFRDIIEEAQYEGQYFGVYPIKVNQLREVIEEVVEAGREYNYGLEAGSKSELLAVLAYNKNPESLTILNGYKDHEYLKLAMLGKKIGRNIVIVIEKFSEIYPVLKLIHYLNYCMR